MLIINSKKDIVYFVIYMTMIVISLGIIMTGITMREGIILFPGIASFIFFLIKIFKKENKEENKKNE